MSAQVPSEYAVWVRTNLNLAPRDGVQDWLIEQLRRELIASSPGQDFDELETMEAVYGPEIARLKKGPLKLLDPQSVEYRTRIADELMAIQRQPLRVVNALARYLCGDRAKLLIVVLDNCDKRTRDEQLAMFQLAQWAQSELRCLTILPLRDITYDMHQHEPPLDTLQKNLVFRIEPPQFMPVLSGRVSLSLKDLERRGGQMLGYALSNGIRVTYPASDQGMYLASILKSLYEHDRFLRRLLTGLAGRNIRRALEIFIDFCQSGYISEGEILKIRQFQGNYALPLSIVASVLLRVNRRFYDGDKSHFKNIFQSIPTDPTPDHFSRISILNCLSSMKDEKGPSGVKGYHRAETVMKVLALHGHSIERIRADLLYLLAAGCLVAEHQRVDTLNDEDLVSITASGMVHLEMLDSVHYLAACAEDTWFSDHQAVARIVARIGRTRLAHLAEATVIQNAREIVDLISREADRWHKEILPMLNTDGVVVNHHHWDLAVHAVERAERDQKKRAQAGRLYVGNLPHDVKEPDLLEVFARASLEVVDVYIAKDSIGKCKGYAFVSLGDHEGVDKAVKTLNGARLGGRPLQVNVAAKRNPRHEK